MNEDATVLEGEGREDLSGSSVVQTGLGVLHLFGSAAAEFDAEAALTAVKEATGHGAQVMTVAGVGHRCDFAVMALHEDLLVLHRLQVRLRQAGCAYADSFVSLTEVSEYARNLTPERARPRLYPKLPPKGREAFCFYPMAKRRKVGQNWYSLPFEERERLMAEHGVSGRKFAGRVTQLVTGATGVSDWEWGVTLFAKHPEDLKAVVYTLRYDEASAVYAEFGPFYVGVIRPPEEVFGELGSLR